jgi:putative addiction module killer protein
MYDVEKTEEFDAWLLGLHDSKTRKVIAKRIRVMASGTLGETKPLDNGLFEAKIRYGPGYRLYFINKGKRIIVLLCGGDKSTQKRDIKKAKEMAKEL